MKKYLVLICFVFLSSPWLEAAEPPVSPYRFSLGLETYYHEYEEPGIMKNDGFFYGISYSAMYEKQILFGIEGLLSYGQVDYSSNSTGESNDIDDVCSETRLLLGRVLSDDGQIRITPFTGFAYRFLQDDSENKITSTNNIGYLRESNYFYSPIGVRLDVTLENGWVVQPKFEYDVFWFGDQKSYLGYIAGYEDVTNDQEGGYGWRASLDIVRKTPTISYGIAFFYRFWDIDDSELTTDSYGRTWIEPDNETRELGVNLSIRF